MMAGNMVKDEVVLKVGPTYRLLHGDVWGSGGIELRIINLGTRWRCVVSFTSRSQSLY